MENKYTGVCSNRFATGRQSMTCTAPVTYTETVCQEELKSIKNCLLGDDNSESVHPLIATDGNLEAAKAILPYVDQASPACAAEVKPFLCLYFFGLCDVAEGVSYQPSASHCRNLRDNVCANEWTTVSTFAQFLPDVPSLPNCDVEFSDETIPCNSDAYGGSGEEGKVTRLCANSKIVFLRPIIFQCVFSVFLELFATLNCSLMVLLYCYLPTESAS